MKAPLFLIAFFAAWSPFLQAAAPVSPEELIGELRTALAEKNPSALESLTYSVGMSDADMQKARTSYQGLVGQGEIEEITTAPLPEDFRLVMVMRGKKFEPTHRPKGLIVIKYKKQGNSAFSMNLPFAEVNGHYHLIGTKTSHLDWSGPPDKQISYGVMGRGSDSARIHVKWNASGVPQENTFSAPTSILIGQYIEKIVVTSDREDTDFTLILREDGKIIHTSEPLKGKGQIEYERK